ncbi:hypothetical protein WJX74_007010 [Apatococcus lobatus]|uniref:Uncharacterized protein n=1 Tax=Apatococcus lobatus TaxID=904363 RepID=A0AAW1RKY6_9CHLO
MQAEAFYSRRWQEVAPPRARSAAADRLLQSISDFDVPAPLPVFLESCLASASVVNELAGTLAALPSLSALQELASFRPNGEWSAAAAVAASSAGHVEVLRWIFGYRSLDPVECSVIAAIWGQKAILRWLLDVPLSQFLREVSGNFSDALDWHGSVYSYIYNLPEHAACAALQTFHALEWPGFEASDISLWAGTQGFITILAWLRSTQPGCVWSTSACRGAAASGDLGVLRWLRSCEPPWAWDSYVCRIAAEEGHSHVLHWMLSHSAACTAASQDHCGVINWLLQQQFCSPLDVATRAAKASSSSTLELLDSGGYLEGLPRSDALILAAGQAILKCAKLLTPYLIGHGHALFWALQESMRRAKSYHMTDEQDLLVISWFYSHFEEFEPWQSRRLLIKAEKSPILLELEYIACGPHLSWNQEAICIAAVHGSNALLQWLLHQEHDCSCRELCGRYGSCSPTRLMLLVHGLKWRFDERYRHTLEDAEKCRLAFYGAARRLRFQPSMRCGLGNLPEPLLKQIACLANLDFSWTFST